MVRARAPVAGQTYLDTHYRNPDMADDLGMSLRQLQRDFSGIGSTPSKYLLVRRLDHAHRRLDARKAGRRDDLISSIAYEAGFSDLSYFRRCCRRSFGKSPKTYLLGREDDADGPEYDLH